MTTQGNTSRFWYREPWPWLLMIAPGAALIGGIITAVIAFRTSDGLVADDYYKQGLTINRAIERSSNAVRMGLTGTLNLNQGRMGLVLPPQAEAGSRVRLILAHPTRAGRDQTVALIRTDDGSYAGSLAPVEVAHWRLQLEDEAGRWRLSSVWDGRAPQVVLRP